MLPTTCPNLSGANSYGKGGGGRRRLRPARGGGPVLVREEVRSRSHEIKAPVVLTCVWLPGKGKEVPGLISLGKRENKCDDRQKESA